MDYEKKYNEALERAKELIAQWTGKNKDVYTEDYSYIFPELRESEDERIRKALIDGVRQIRCKNGITQEQMIAYLEKQKGNQYFVGYVKGYSEGQLNPKQKEQKPYEPKNWPADKDALTQEQKPAEWSNTDNIGWDEAFACVTRAEKAAKNEEELQNAVTAEKWLKEIKFKYYVQPVKPEWSEEDELNCNRIIRFLEPHKTFFPMKETKEEMQNWLKNRLKSLRPQPRWKPSEEQMDALAYAIQLLDDGLSPKAAKAGEELEHFREQLKKL